MLLPEFHTTPVRSGFVGPTDKPTATLTRSSGGASGVASSPEAARASSTGAIGGQPVACGEPFGIGRQACNTPAPSATATTSIANRPNRIPKPPYPDVGVRT